MQFPKLMKSTSDNLVVEFTSMTTGKVIESEVYYANVGDIFTTWTPCDNTRVWKECIETPKEPKKAKEAKETTTIEEVDNYGVIITIKSTGFTFYRDKTGSLLPITPNIKI